MLLGAKGIATRSKDATRGSWPYLLGTRTLVGWRPLGSRPCLNFEQTRAQIRRTNQGRSKDPLSDTYNMGRPLNNYSNGGVTYWNIFLNNFNWNNSLTGGQENYVRGG